MPNNTSAMPMMPFPQWQQGGQYWQYGNYRVFYRIEGAQDAPVLLLIHGFPTSSWDWSPLWPELSRHFRVITLDLLGFGLSDKPRNHVYSILDQADLITDLLTQLSIERYHVLAHDYGDTVAQELLARSMDDDQRVASAILLNGGLFPETHRPVLVQKLLLSPVGKWVAQRVSYKKFKANLDRICSVPIPEPELRQHWALLENKSGRQVMHRLIAYMTERKIYRSRWIGALQKAPCKVRLINGVEDPISGQHMLERYEQLVADADVVALEGVGHYPQLEAPERVYEACFQFWQSLGVIV